MIGLLALLLRFIILAGFTFGFVVLFEHGPADYPQNAVIEWRHFAAFVQERTGLKAPEAPHAPMDSTTPTDSATPVDSAAPSEAPSPAPAANNL